MFQTLVGGSALRGRCPGLRQSSKEEGLIGVCPKLQGEELDKHPHPWVSGGLRPYLWEVVMTYDAGLRAEGSPRISPG